MKRSVTLAEYIQWRDKTQGGLTTKRVKYKVLEARTSACVAEAIIDITDSMRKLVTTGLYSSVVLAALDLAKVDKSIQHPKATSTSVNGDVVTCQTKIPIFQVTAIDEEAPNGCTVYVEGVI